MLQLQDYKVCLFYSRVILPINNTDFCSRMMLPINVTSWDKISRMSQFFNLELNIPVFRPHPVLQTGENKTSVLCLCPKLLNFEFGETANLKI